MKKIQSEQAAAERYRLQMSDGTHYQPCKAILMTVQDGVCLFGIFASDKETDTKPSKETTVRVQWGQGRLQKWE